MARAMRRLAKGLVVKKFLPLAFMPVLAFACTPDIAQDNPNSNSSIEILFDPGAATPVVPAPNDLAKDQATGKLAVPTAANATDAQKEFNGYLNSLDNFPFESTASVGTSGDLNPSTVTAANVLVIDITNAAVPTIATGYTPTYANKSISIAPPKGGWTRGHHYAVALYAGSGGLQGAAGQPVVGSVTWALVSGTNSLVTCPDLKTNCRPAVDIIPSDLSDPQARLDDQTKKALQLEQIRLSYKPILDGLGTLLGKPRETIPIVWTFGITDSPEVLFDPANSVIPFPNDVLRDPTAANPAGGVGRIKLPNPKTFAPLTDSDCASPTDSSIQLVCGLNTLDGWSTTVPPESENAADLGALEQGTIDKATLSQASVGLARVAHDAASTSDTQPNWQPCINCANSDPNATLQTLQWNLLAPLDERSTYFAYVTSDVKDDKQKSVIANPVFALVRSKASLLTADGKSAVSIISDDQAKQLEPLRKGMEPAFDALAAKGLTRDKVALAFGFTTQSEGSVLDQIRAAIVAQSATALPDVPLPPPASANPPDLVLTDITAATPLAAAGVAKVFETNIVTPLLITGPSGTLDPSNPKPKLVAVDIIVPTTAPAPAAGYRIAIFGHGFTRSRNDAFALAAKVAAQDQQVIVMMNWLNHGNDRSSCTGSKLATGFASDDQSCAGSKCDEDPLQGLCVLADNAQRADCAGATQVQKDLSCMGRTPSQGFCAADNKCQGDGARLARDSDVGGAAAGNRPLISGWNAFNPANFFQTRDNFRQAVVDFTQLVRVLKSANPANIGQRLQVSMASATPVIDNTKIGYVGQSLGGINGALVNSVSPDTDNIVLNVPGGALTKLVLNASDTLVKKLADGLIAGLKAQGIEVGTPAFDQFIGFAQWIVDPADPINIGYRLTHPVNGAPSANRKVFIQFIEKDPTVPNISNLALVAGANRTFDPTAKPGLGCQAPLFCYEFTEAGDSFDETTAPVANRHGFLLSPGPGSAGPTLTQKAQLQASTFLKTGALP